MKPIKLLPQVKKTDKTSAVLENETKMLEEKLKILKQQVEYEKEQRSGKRNWSTANTNMPLTNYSKKVLSNRNVQNDNKKTQKLEKIDQNKQIEKSLSLTQHKQIELCLETFLNEFGCAKFQENFTNHNIITLQDLLNFPDISKIDIPPGFKIKMKIKLQKLKPNQQIQKQQISDQLDIIPKQKNPYSDGNLKNQQTIIENQQQECQTEVMVEKDCCFNCFKTIFVDQMIYASDKLFCVQECLEIYLKSLQGMCVVCNQSTKNKNLIFCSEKCQNNDEIEFNKQMKYEKEKQFSFQDKQNLDSNVQENLESNVQENEFQSYQIDLTI